MKICKNRLDFEGIDENGNFSGINAFYSDLTRSTKNRNYKFFFRQVKEGIMIELRRIKRWYK